MDGGSGGTCNGFNEPGQPREKDSLISKTVGRTEAFFVIYKDHIAWVHIAMFLGFLLLIFVPPFLPDPAEDATLFNNFTEFANYAMWGIWFPLVFASVIFTGRSWCGLLCPMGAASEWANRFGLQRPIPAWVRWSGTPIISFLIITILGQTVGVRDHPEAILEIFGGTMAAAIVLGFVYGRNKRAWCRHMCPIGLLLGVFSRLGAIQFVPKKLKAGGEGYTEKGVCPTMIDLKQKKESRHCIECFRCVNPQAKGGLYLHARKPGEEIEQIRGHNPNAAEIWFLFLGTGLALGGFLWMVLPLYEKMRQSVGEFLFGLGWHWIGRPGPAWLMVVQPERREVFMWLDFLMISTFMLAVMVLLATILTVSTAASARLSGRAGGDLDFRRRFVELGYQYAPVAMVSLIIGLGGKVFDLLSLAGLDDAGISAIKVALFFFGIVWSVHLGNRLLAGQRVPAKRRFLPLLPGLAGSLVVAALWWPAIFS